MAIRKTVSLDYALGVWLEDFLRSTHSSEGKAYQDTYTAAPKAPNRHLLSPTNTHCIFSIAEGQQKGKNKQTDLSSGKVYEEKGTDIICAYIYAFIYISDF